jgi:putative membrane protein insertion efficiency factor
MSTLPRRLLALLLWLPARLLWLLVRVYQLFISPVLPPACRYHPSCSQYAAEALLTHGPIRGTWLAVRRLLRCHPWAVGGPDPVPPKADAPPRALRVERRSLRTP